jgi:diguanylate cyclase (GGDEF)-like protein
MSVQRRLGGFPLAVYVVALLIIPLTALGWFSVREVERNNASAASSNVISNNLTAAAAASGGLAPLEIERLAAHGELALEADSSDRFGGLDFADLRRQAEPAVEAALDDLDQALRRDPIENAARLQTLSQSRALLDGERARLAATDATSITVDSAFGIALEQLHNVIGDAERSIEEIEFGSPEAIRLASDLGLLVSLIETGQSEMHTVVSTVFGVGAVSRVDMMMGEVRHIDALDSALVVDPALIDGLRDAHSQIAPLGADAGDVLTSQVNYLQRLDQGVAASSANIANQIGAWSTAAQSRNRTTLMLLIVVGAASLLFGLIVMRSFASPLTRLRLQAERISRGELGAEPLPVMGPSDVRKVTGALNDMASTLTLVEEHMDALALAEMNAAPELDELPGHVGAAMRSSIGRVVALTTRLQRSESRLAEEARIDNLTGLPNRFAVLEYLEQVLRTLPPPGTPVAPGGRRSTGVMFLDVDGFKSVNDMHGHAVGDIVLRDIAQRLRGSVREIDFVARLGGDEFLVVVADIGDAAQLIKFGERMIAEVEQPYTSGDQLFAVSASVGITVVEQGDDSMSVIERADAAVYQAKDRGRRRVEMFDKELQRSIEHQAELELALRQAIQHGELRMYLQPMADLSTGLPSGAEALVRWERPGYGLVPPGDFIPIAERSGLIFELERWMLDAACRRIAEWKLMGQGEGMRLAVNISGRHLIEGNLIADLDDALAATGADGNLLEIELTESQLLDDVERASSVLAAVRDRGVKVAIDDFGTGYSSMTYLQKLPVDKVKIDRSFISSATTNEFDSTIVDTVVTIGKALSMDIVAEGIETVEQLAYVINAGVTHGQGFLLARPVPALEAEAVIFNGPLFDRERVMGHEAELFAAWTSKVPSGPAVDLG